MNILNFYETYIDVQSLWKLLIKTRFTSFPFHALWMFYSLYLLSLRWFMKIIMITNFYTLISSIMKYSWNFWHLKRFIAAIKHFCLNTASFIFLQISFENKSTVGFECVSHLPSANCINNFMAADFLIFEPSFFYIDGYTLWD